MPRKKLDRCANFKRYKALKPPSCKGGRVCDGCREKWVRARTRATAGLLHLKWKGLENAAHKAYGYFEDALAALQKDCKHEHVITLCSPYEGSYSRDYDDRHPGARLCLVCGFTERVNSTNDYTKLLNPISRFELGTSAWPIEQVLAYDLNHLINLAREKGYAIV
jgi:hypothetical protein